MTTEALVVMTILVLLLLLPGGSNPPSVLTKDRYKEDYDDDLINRK